MIVVFTIPVSRSSGNTESDASSYSSSPPLPSHPLPFMLTLFISKTKSLSSFRFFSWFLQKPTVELHSQTEKNIQNTTRKKKKKKKREKTIKFPPSSIPFPLSRLFFSLLLILLLSLTLYCKTFKQKSVFFRQYSRLFFFSPVLWWVKLEIKCKEK